MILLPLGRVTTIPAVTRVTSMQYFSSQKKISGAAGVGYGEGRGGHGDDVVAAESIN